MKKALSMQLRKTVLSWHLVITTVAGLIMLMWYSVVNCIQYNRFIGQISYGEICGDFLNALYQAHARTGFSLFAPIFAVIPAGTLFCDDYNSGYIRSVLLRTSISKYIREKIICCSIAGGLAVFLPEFICSCVYVIVGTPHIPSHYSSYLDDSIFSEFQYIGNGALVLLLFLLFAFLFGAVWSNIGLCISSYVPNKYVALSTPFAIYYSSHLLLNRSVTFSVLSPANMLQPTSRLLPSIVFPFVYQALLLVVSCLLFSQKVSRRVHDV